MVAVSALVPIAFRLRQDEAPREMSITNFERAVLVNSGIIEYENGRSLL